MKKNSEVALNIPLVTFTKVANISCKCLHCSTHRPQVAFLDNHLEVIIEKCGAFSGQSLRGIFDNRLSNYTKSTYNSKEPTPWKYIK